MRDCHIVSRNPQLWINDPKIMTSLSTCGGLT
jgi:hypothetical protein